MLPVLSTPLALLGFAALPALAAIYYLHTRSRLHPVSSLLLWTDARVAPDGGRQVDRPRLPLVFWLELLVLALLALAAAGVHVPATTGAGPLIVVLDDSFSMRAGAPESPRKRAAEALLDDLHRVPRSSVRFVLAGDRPQILGEAVSHTSEIEHLLEGWTCQTATARLDSAVALALEFGGESARVLVLTDHAPEAPLKEGRVRWWALGSAAPNWAFVNASRTAGPRGDRLLIEVANLAPEARSTTLRIEEVQPARELRRSELKVGAGETQRLVLELPEATGTVRAIVDDSELDIDNSASLLAAARKSVTYEVRLADKELRSAFERALKATGTAVPTNLRPQLVLVDGAVVAPDVEDSWAVRVLREPEAEAFTGPFVLDRAHPLTDGLSLTGVVWGAGKGPLSGSPVVMAGNVPLLTDTESATGRHEVQLRLRPDLSTLTQSPAWPALVWNLVHWRASFQPGLQRANVRLGEEAVWTLNTSPGSIEVTKPGGERSTVPVYARRAAIRAERPGVYSLRGGTESADFAANALNRDESDLTKCVTGRWGDELNETTLRNDYRDVTAWFVLVALAIATLHVRLLARKPATGANP
ncbi:VWA domain-containing protein [Gemmata sp. G18]|uniref:VWA domain-containing protein n=1 Tax=Gemmata palustris TaxID=2822762 RepID=A0ABS5BLV5_9BACT|nr:VWA domain-containing protein [Gemmata palustris]MBP3954699.1 VWA domain-containing protein [Gemmata palustris]